MVEVGNRAKAKSEYFGARDSQNHELVKSKKGIEGFGHKP